jgi:hypothetical protein
MEETSDSTVSYAETFLSKKLPEVTGLNFFPKLIGLISWDIHTKDGRCYRQISGWNSNGYYISNNSLDKKQVKVYISLSDSTLEGLEKGVVEFAKAFAKGKIRVSGDISFIYKFMKNLKEYSTYKKGLETYTKATSSYRRTRGFGFVPLNNLKTLN